MLRIVGEFGYRYEWRLGKAFAPGDLPWGGMFVVVDADGEELAFVREHFSNIPMTDGEHVRWGDRATVAFLTDNLSLLAPIVKRQRKQAA